ncbi:uncharacterized protein C17orf67 homolog isoform X1 [Onychomys torridus]|uniref:uncharacterized protein C17orf67 homolog isoform X1 n=1 Tax=Onychomys torridus TaxID=38674 RepID=UPI00167F80BC|nr:uncharacterized protein C17orf67 homolog isoform X1 [Onychomys torridus]
MMNKASMNIWAAFHVDTVFNSFGLDSRLALATRTVGWPWLASPAGQTQIEANIPEEKLKSICGSPQGAGRPLSKANTSHHCFAAPNRKGRKPPRF